MALKPFWKNEGHNSNVTNSLHSGCYQWFPNNLSTKGIFRNFDNYFKGWVIKQKLVGKFRIVFPYVRGWNIFLLWSQNTISITNFMQQFITWDQIHLGLAKDWFWRVRCRLGMRYPHFNGWILFTLTRVLNNEWLSNVLNMLRTCVYFGITKRKFFDKGLFRI